MRRVSWLLLLTCLFLPQVAHAIQLHWAGGATDLTVNQNTQAVLVVQADSAEATLPNTWRLLWTADSLGVQFSPFAQACLVDTAKVDSIAPPSTPADSAANQITAYFCSSGSNNAATAYFLADLLADGHGKLKILALDPADTTQVIESNEVTFNGGIGGGYSATLLSAAYSHRGSKLLVQGTGGGLSMLSGARLVATDGAWEFPLAITQQDGASFTAVATTVAAVPDCILEVGMAGGGAVQTDVAAEPPSIPEAPLFTPATMTDPDVDFYPKDFAMIYTPGKVHIIYIRHNQWDKQHGGDPVPDNVNEREFGHQWTSDWVNWNFNSLPLDTTILSTSEAVGTWDNRHVWAPHIVQVGLTFYMMYTGVYRDPVTGKQHQSIGLARSTDLDNWTRNGLASWGVDSVGAWADKTVAAYPYSGNKQFRDPYVIPDPSHAGKWLMYFVTALANQFPDMVVGVARSVDSLGGRWTDVGPLVKTDSLTTFSPQIESPHVVNTHGKWWLFFTTNSGHAVSFENVSGDPVDNGGTDSLRWSSQTRLYNYLLGHSSSAATTVKDWIASEYLQVGGREIIGGYDGAGIRIGELQWWSAAPDSFTLITPTFAAVDDGQIKVQTTRLFVAALHPGAGHVELCLELPRAARARLAVFDVLGRRIATIFDASVGAGRTTVKWDGRGTSGERVGSGVYFAKLFTSAGDRIARVPLMW